MKGLVEEEEEEEVENEAAPNYQPNMACEDDECIPQDFARMEHKSPPERVSYFSYQELSHAWHKYHVGLDAEMVLISLSLFLLSLFILSPTSSVRGWTLRRRRLLQAENNGSCWNSWQLENQDPHAEGEEGLSCTRTMSTNNSTYAEEEETDEDKFEKLWPVICVSGYRRLVLPPECKLVHVPAFLKRQKEEQREEARARTLHHTEITDDDHPLQRLKVYTGQLLHLLRTFLSYDYIKAGQMLMTWIQYWLTLKQRKTESVVLEEEEETEEAATLNTSKRIEEIEIVSNVQSGLVRGVSDTSDVFLSVSGSDDDENDIGPLQMPFDTSHRNIGKKKDALDSYRLTMKNVGPLTPTRPKSSRIAESPEMMTPRQNEEELSDHNKSYKDFGGMSFFDAAHSKASLRRLHVEVPVPDRNGYILGDDFLPNIRQTPLLVFVNSRSGPQQGHLLVGQLRRLLNPIQVWDLADGSPERILESFCVLSRLRILVCGGDGTVSWIISCLEKMKIERWPPIAILPLGTGNDLARIHGWGGGYNNESLIAILEQVSEAYISLLDRWEIKIVNKKGQVEATKSFFNYVGVGADAQAALQVHMLRESKPNLFFSRLVNKMWYLVFGAEEVIKESNINLTKEITLIADGVEVPLPQDSQGIILLNVDSFSGGVPMWSLGVKEDAYNHNETNSPGGKSYSNLREAGPLEPISPRRAQSMCHLSTDHYQHPFFSRENSIEDFQHLSEKSKHEQLFACDRPSSCQDGILDVVSVRGTFHLGQIRVGLSNATRVCQASEVKVIIKKKVATQIDGEPWRQHACTMTISRKKDPAVMLHRSNDESGGVETEMAKLLDWAEDRKIIDRNVHDTLMKEFSRRIESKKRERRVKSQDNLMHTLKRAMLSGGGSVTQGSFPVTLTF